MQRTARRFFSFVPSLLSILMGIGFIAILALLVAGQPSLSQYYQPVSLLSNGWLYPAALALVVLLFFMASRTTKQLKSRRLLSALLQCAVLCVQFLIARSCWYKMGWDVATVYTTAEELARGLIPTQLDYFHAYPNNATLTLLHAFPMWIAIRIGLVVPFVVLPYIDAILLNLASYFCYRCVQLLTTNRISHCFARIVSIGWIAFSPYILYPYTDTFSILFPVLAFYFWLRITPPCLKWFLVSLVCFAGAAIKPTVLIVLIALLLLSICHFISKLNFSLATFKRSMVLLIVLLIGMLPGKLFENYSIYYLTGSTHPQAEHGLGYWAMTGMNGKSFGGHTDADVQYANSFSNYNERQSACLQRAWERLTGRTFAENLHFFTVKAYKAYADGSFASHSSFLELETPKRTDSLSVFLRSLYHKRGSLMPYCQTLIQGVWLGVLTLCAYACIRLRKNAFVSILALTLLGLTLYVLLLEVWPRYLFLYMPFFVILAAMAFEKPLSFKR